MKKQIFILLAAFCLLAGVSAAAFAATIPGDAEASYLEIVQSNGTEEDTDVSVGKTETPMDKICAELESCVEGVHGAGCPLYAEQDGDKDQLAALIGALPAPEAINPEDEAQIQAIYTFAEENGLDVTDDAVISAVIAAMYPVELLDEPAQASYTSDGGATDTGTFADMLEKANNDGGTVTLLQDIAFGQDEGVTITGTVTFDLNGYEISNSLSTEFLGKLEYCKDSDKKRPIKIASSGSLTLQDSSTGGNIKNGVLVSKGGTFIMESGSIANSEYLNGVKNGGTFIMNGGVISNNCHAAGHGGGVSVSASATFTMNGGKVTKNKAYVYGETKGGGVYVDEGSFIMNDGEISENELECYTKAYRCIGGGVCIYGNDSTFVMNGGKIIQNKAVDYDPDYDDYRGQGGGVYIEGAAYFGKITSTFQMTGGEISGNTSALSGGGIYIDHNACVDISAGHISNNESLISSGGGISIYNASIVKGSDWGGYTPGELHLKNVVITDNTAKDYISGEKNYGSYGGGIATCPTSATYVYLAEGGAIYGNHSAYGELLAQQIKPEYANLHVLYLSAYMLGGGAYRWTDLDGTSIEADQFMDLEPADFIATNAIAADSDAAKAAAALAKVYITGNSAYYVGGGIMNNGILEIGTSDASLRVEKQVVNGLGTDDYSFTVSFWTENGAGGKTPYTKEIICLGSDTNGVQTMTPDSNGQMSFTLGKADYIVFYHLDDGVHYKVEETSSGNYTTAYSNQEGTVTKGSMATVVTTNTYPTGTLTITKNVVNDEAEENDTDKKFKFELIVQDQDGKPIKDAGAAIAATVKVLSWNVVNQGVELRSTNAGAASRATLVPTYTTSTITLHLDENGKVTFELADGGSITLTLPIGTNYEVIETAASQAGYTVAVSGDDKGEITADGAEVTFTNTKSDDPTPEPDKTGSLTIGKTVSGSGASTDKLFTFTVKLTDKDKAPISGDFAYTGASSVDGVTAPADGSISFDETGTAVLQLSHGQSITIADLPEGAAFTVTESDNSGYTVTATGAEGIIVENTTATAAFANYRGSSGGGGPDNPSPEKPEEPKDPEDPEEPTTPEEPSTPDEPTVPDETNTPSEPDTPEEPNIPGDAGNPDDPEYGLDDPSIPKGGAEAPGDGTADGAPKTGDTAPIAVFAVLLFAAAGGLLITGRKRNQ